MISTEDKVSGKKRAYPWEDWVRSDRLPHIWCPECGIGIALSCFTAALTNLRQDPDRVAVVSGIGCSGRVAGYLKLDSFHTTHGRAIPFATGLKMANPGPEGRRVQRRRRPRLHRREPLHPRRSSQRRLEGDLHQQLQLRDDRRPGRPHDPRQREVHDDSVRQLRAPVQPARARRSSGAVYVARWTTLHVRRLIKACEEALTKRGFSFVEVISPCPTLYTRRNKLGSGLEWMRMFQSKTDVKHGAPPDSVNIEFGGRITLGKFVDIDKPTFDENIDRSMRAALGTEYHKLDMPQAFRPERRAFRDL